jgi:Ran GTPase-activating protein (RanGAP) involved in mRNA processing and transport
VFISSQYLIRFFSLYVSLYKLPTIVFTLCLALTYKVADLLAQSLCDLTDIEAIDLTDNILTDLSLKPLMQSICSLPNLQVLNLSSNTIGHSSARAMADYLALPDCSLKKLMLHNANVGDFECEIIVASVKNNLNLLEIDLSSNRIGSAELLNVVRPDLVTGGEAIAALLRSPNASLQTLKLGWNMLRLHSAVDLVGSYF